MFNPTQPMMARLRLTTKQVNGGYYKGNRTGSMGHFDKRGTYRPDATKHRVYISPEKLEVPGKIYSTKNSKEPFELAPFITKHMRKTPSNYVQDIERNGRKFSVIRGFEGADYLEKWAETAEAEEVRLAQSQAKLNEDKEVVSKRKPKHREQADEVARSTEGDAPITDKA
ncbi:50S ribosomal protein YmL27 [Penicillium paradoxum]|uniref:50S ribosomal protein YmL27 n=1 Tax=Penicillium paradoxum TaxID=176176 RepID=UPI002549254F|nr:50S ribosomal protein YmL27 [Penicillium paradoxum]KAJ5788600.1 50S ribosomal protein YmL27 [Penicillium paradoxum]